MLSQSAVESAYTAAEDLDSKNIAVVAKPGSLLASLVASTYIEYDPRVTEGGFYIDIGKMAAMTDRANPATGFSEHSARMEETADFLKDRLLDYLNHARTVAAPYVDEFAKRLSAQMSLIDASPESGVNVTVRAGANVLYEPALFDAFRKFSDEPYETLRMTMRLPEANDAEVLAYMSTGSATVDAGVLEYFGKKPEGYLAATFCNIFRHGADPLAPVAENGIDAYISKRDNIANALLGFLVARRLWNAPPQGTEMAADEYSTAMAQIRAQCALRLCQEVERIERDGRSGILVCGVSRDGANTTVEVNKDQYDQYLRDGGTADALMGNQLQAHPYILTKDILANKDTLESAWKRHYSLNQSYYDARRILRMREAVLYEWDQLAKECSHEEFPLSDRFVAGTLIKRMAEEITANCLDDLGTLSMRLVCRARFPRTADEAILSGIDRAKKKNPGITTRDAADISILEYLYSYVGNSMSVVSARKTGVFGPQDSQLV